MHELANERKGDKERKDKRREETNKQTKCAIFQEAQKMTLSPTQH